MTIKLPKDLESSIREEVLSGHFASEDEMVAEVLRDPEPAESGAGGSGSDEAGGQDAPAHKPIWEVFQEISASVPDEVWDALPTDLSEQHDHYIYGTPKRPAE